MKIDIVDSSAKKVGEAELAASVFEAKVNATLLRDTVVAQLASRRRGTHATKGRSEVRGGGAKPWRQKGTGRARAGSIRSPLFRGGGIVFGPKPRDYSYRLPKKMRAAALKSALTVKAAEQAIVVVDDFGITEPKTKSAAALLAALGAADKKTLVVTHAASENGAVEKSFRNIPTVKIIRAEGVNVYDLLNAERVVMTNEALTAVSGRLA